MMHLKKSILLAITGICYIFITRAIGTFWPEIFMDISLARTNSILSLAAAITVLLFYYVLYTSYAIPGQPVIRKSESAIKNATRAAIIGALIVIPLFVKGVALTFDMYEFPFSDGYKVPILLVMLGSAVCGLYFVLIFYDETFKKVSARLSSAVKLAIIGSSLGLVIRIYLFLNYYYSSQFKWSGDLTREVPLIVIAIQLFIFFSTIYFLWTFYREISEKGYRDI